VPLERLESLAVAQRLDVDAGRWAVDLVGRALALRTKTRYFPVGIHVGVEHEKDTGGQRVTGPSIALQLPIFDTGQASIARLNAEYQRAQRQLEAVAVDARSEVREARDAMIAARDLAAYYRTVLLPQRVQILDQTQRHYNMMLKSAYDLLLARQAEVAAERAYVEAWKDYWIARTELERAVGGRLPGASSPAKGEDAEQTRSEGGNAR
jgi:cobalt-zinc-cadmium efflux system outer membrane protein